MISDVTAVSQILVSVVLMVLGIDPDQSVMRPEAKEALARLSRQIAQDGGRYWIDGSPTAASDFKVRPERADDAVRNAAVWIRAIVSADNLPADLESYVELLPGAINGPEGVVWQGRSIRHDAARTSFVRGGRHFIIIQDSMAIWIFVSFDNGLLSDGLRNVDEMAEGLAAWIKRLFRHSTVGLYLRGIRVTDFGIETVKPSEAWDFDERRWKPNIIRQPQVCFEGLLEPTWDTAFMGSGNAGVRMRELDQTLPKEWNNDDLGRLWWSNVYAATDGSVIVYGVGKTAPGARNVLIVPDWFRNSDEEELNADTKSVSTTRPRNVSLPPDE